MRERDDRRLDTLRASKADRVPDWPFAVERLKAGSRFPTVQLRTERREHARSVHAKGENEPRSLGRQLLCEKPSAPFDERGVLGSGEWARGGAAGAQAYVDVREKAALRGSW
ncbi:MAG: hypothetical protein WKG32_14590 [Gemmatimonadaceae bacterium]